MTGRREARAEHPAMGQKAISQQGSDASSLRLYLSRQMQSGKNRVLITRTGRRYAPKRFAEWRRACVAELQGQIRRQDMLCPISEPVRLCCAYVPGDARTRDVDGMLGALMHVLVHAGVLIDDGLIHEAHWTRLPLDRARPSVVMTIERIGAPR